MTTSMTTVATATPVTDQRIHSTHRFDSFDAAPIFYRAWEPLDPLRAHTALVLFHGGHEHSGRFEDLVRELGFPGRIFAWDARGHGLTEGIRGHAEHFMDFVRDAESFTRHLQEKYDLRLEDMAVLGHSVGSVIAATWIHDYAPPVRGAVLGSPAFDVKLYVPLAIPALRAWQRWRPRSFVRSYVRPGMLTHDRDEAVERAIDPLISPQISVRVLTSLYDTADRVIRDAEAIRCPVLLMSAGSDWVVKRSAQRRFFAALPTSDSSRHVVYPGFYHEIFHERDRDLPIADARQFLSKVFALQPERSTQPERRTEPNRRFGPKRAAHRLFSGLFRTVGRLSQGVRVGYRHGFDSFTEHPWCYPYPCYWHRWPWYAPA